MHDGLAIDSKIDDDDIRKRLRDSKSTAVQPAPPDIRSWQLLRQRHCQVTVPTQLRQPQLRQV